ncbi:MAG: hypothetical protein K1X88_25320 [Nannocystaceae bacterium]|nr:hypothetical protein [Nannocystaceae bacterium]
MELLSQPRDGELIDATSTMYPSRLVAVRGRREFGPSTSTFFGYVVGGSGRLQAGSFEMSLQPETFFCVPGPAMVEIDGLAVVIERLGYRGIPTAGLIEARGRLTYIDGCSDTILVSPPRLGDPVFNFLHFPPGIQQTVHSHPSIRLGVVARGEGHAFGPAHGAKPAWEIPLRPGAVFLLHPHEMHAFRTTASGQSMDVIAYHPDSDWGPTDAVHPMLNRTYRGM